MSRMAQAIAAVDSPIRVEGFTDNVPITGGRFASNWQLSAARAASVAQSFASSGINPELLSAIGYGEFHPIASNDSVEGRGQNRRVVVAIAKHKSAGVIGPVVNADKQTDSIQTKVLRRVTQLPGSIGIL
jgi:chemotaxis protein MotB